jgi:hypothetical protein
MNPKYALKNRKIILDLGIYGVMEVRLAFGNQNVSTLKKRF